VLGSGEIFKGALGLSKVSEPIRDEK